MSRENSVKILETHKKLQKRRLLVLKRRSRRGGPTGKYSPTTSTPARTGYKDEAQHDIFYQGTKEKGRVFGTTEKEAGCAGGVWRRALLDRVVTELSFVHMFSKETL